MRVKFNGLVETQSKGCKPCGRVSTGQTTTRKWDMTLPSGNRVSFQYGRTKDVLDSDGEWLLTNFNKTRKVFERI